jgi:hypothetical protein
MFKVKSLKIWLPLVFALVLVLFTALPVNAGTSNNITITVTPSYINISTATNTWAPGGSINTTYYSNPLGAKTAPSSTVADGECRFTTVNTSTVGIDVTVNIPDFTGGDAMTNSNTGSNGDGTFGAYSYCSGMTFADKVIAKASSSDPLISDQASTTDFKWGVQLTTQATNATDHTASWHSSTSENSTMVLAAVEH